MTKRGLGKGLGALIPGATSAPLDAMREVEVSKLSPNPYQPREDIAGPEFDELVESVRRHGVLQPLIVRPSSQGFEIVAGERRWRAAQQAGVERVPVVVREVSDRQMLEIALIENLQRENLSPIERAKAYKRLIEEFGMTQEQVAGSTGTSRSSVANVLRLLELPQEIQRAIDEGRISEGHGRALLMVSDEASRISIWQSIESKGLSVRDTENIARKRAKNVSRETSLSDADATQLADVARQLEERYAVPVDIVKNKRKKIIKFHCYSPVDLERVVELLLR